MGFWRLLAVLRSAEGFDASRWQPVGKMLDLADDMYTGLVVDVECPAERKSIKIHVTGVAGNANLILREGQKTQKLMRARAGEETLGPEMFFVYAEEFAIVASLSATNEARALEALRLFLAPGTAMGRVNAAFVKGAAD